MGNDQLLFINRSITSASTSLLNLKSRAQKLLGGGLGTYIREGPNEGLVLLRGQKRYFVGGGAFWLNALVNLNGELIEFLPSENAHGPCVEIADILGKTESSRKFRQSLSECVVVSR